ncbi:class I SAM-dependent methyltransferase [Stutzerimonas kunmingensis]|uniref:class I SAM-dependent methyltransferase n=1 Tax=Stutzerimonas kunmingensis TaxID=1211807 RepID=UPI003AB34287
MKITQEDLAQFVPSLRLPGNKTLLHIGCGTASPERLPDCFKSAQWHEVKLDVDPKVKPDIVASLTDMSVVASASVDAVWSSHNIEHLEGFQVAGALGEIRRVLKPGGFALITLPDLQRIAELIAQGRGDDVMYTSPAGPITPLDMLFGHQASLARGNHYMAHRTGFTAERLGTKLAEAGFGEVRVVKGRSFDLWAVALNDAASNQAAQQTQSLNCPQERRA